MTHTIRVYFEDTDAGGIVYHASYLKFAERARTEALRRLGFNQSELRAEYGIRFVVRKITCDYFKPAFLDDLLTVTAETSEIGRSRFHMRQLVMRGDELLTELDVVLVCIDETGRPTRLPEPVAQQLAPQQVPSPKTPVSS